MRAGAVLLYAGILGTGLAAVQKASPEVAPGTGRELFARRCAGCHGMDGRGKGIAAPGLTVPPPDLTTLALRNGTFPYARVSGTITGDLPRREFMTREMPCFGLGRGMPQSRVAALTEYIRALQRK